jgi:HAD superfamily hydrolase (TIGR01509 family)
VKDYELVIFDCDGVLVDSEVLSCTCLMRVLARFGLELDLSEIYETFLGRGYSCVVGHYEATTGRPLPDGFAEALRLEVADAFSQSLRPMPEIHDLLRVLDRPSCVASSSLPERLALCLGLTGLDIHFKDRVFSASMVARGKPAPDLFLYAAASLGADPRRTLVIEDSVSGVQAGKAAGMTVWGFTGGSHYAMRDGRHLLTRAGADRILASMAEFELM